jgi:hypothetical protein
MTKDIEQLIRTYRRIWQSVSWQPHPLSEHILYATDDTVIRNVLSKLNQLSPASNPSPRMVETAATDVDVHYIIVGYDDQMVLYWFTYFTTVGDSGYHLYRITNFTGPSVNLLEYGYLFDLPEASMAAFYMDVYSRLNEWAKLLELPYRYEVELRDEYMGFERIDKPDRALTDQAIPAISSGLFWRRWWNRVFSTE